jgi:hypothetical protein
MNWIKKKIPKLLIWLFFGIAFAVLPMLILGGMTWFDLDVSQGWLAVKETIAKGDLLLVIAAVVADSIGRLLQDVVTQNPRTYVGLKITLVVILGVVAVACGLEYVKANSDLPALMIKNPTPGQQAMAQRIAVHLTDSSKIFSAVAFALGFVVILMVED